MLLFTNHFHILYLFNVGLVSPSILCHSKTLMTTVNFSFDQKTMKNIFLGKKL